MVQDKISARCGVLLDALRWISAALVLLTHLNSRMFVSFAETAPEHKGVALYLWTFLCGFGHPAVVVFFVMSGFLVGGPLLTAVKRVGMGNPGLPKYFVDRTVRIYLVLVPVVVITCLADAMGRALALPVYADIGVEHYGWWAVAGTLLNVQNFLAPFVGSNGPLGTLANEWWYYLTAPFLMLAWVRRTPLFLLGGVVALALNLAFASVWSWHGIGLVIWLMGALAYHLDVRPLRSPSVALLLAVAVIVGSRLLFRASDLTHFATGGAVDLVQAIVIANLLLTFKRVPGEVSTRIRDLAASFAGFSYSLYAAHVPVMTLLIAGSVAAFGYGHREQPTPGGILVALGFAFLVCVSAYLLSWLTERRTYNVRQVAYAALGVRTRRGAQV